MVQVRLKHLTPNSVMQLAVGLQGDR